MIDIVAEMRNPATYPHAVHEVELVETHMSWVFLTGDFVYKVKKPVDFGFADFTTLDRRRHFCEEELRCNRAFAEDLYLDVVALLEGDTGLRIEPAAKATDAPVEFAVKMRQFDPAQQADRLLEKDALTETDLHRFGVALAEQHALLPRYDGPYDPHEPVLANFESLRQAAAAAPFAAAVGTLAARSQEQLDRWRSLLASRARDGFVRECHGDLHLSNMTRIGDALVAFDCLEFDPALRNIDVYADAGFLVMDLCVRDAEGLAYVFLDGYLDQTGDYEGAWLLPLFTVYRSMVRAKVAALRHAQSHADADLDKLRRLLDWALVRTDRGPGKLWVTCGVSGSGKSYWGAQLVGPLCALRLRSDLLRKTSHGLERGESSHSAVGSGLYSKDKSAAVYSRLAELAGELLSQGENVLVDAASLTREQRAELRGAAERVQASYRVLHFTAPEAVLRERIESRRNEGRDPSEADGAVLSWQLQHAESPGPDERSVTIDTTRVTLPELVTLARQE